MLSPIPRTPSESLNLAWRRVKPVRQELEAFRTGLRQLLEHLDLSESEENNKNYLRTFLEDTGYKGKYLLATKGRTDLVIHRGKTASEPAAVLFEVKRASKSSEHKNEMVSRSDLNRKAFHELLYYFMQERKAGNIYIKHLVITNVTEWFIFDAAHFEKLFFENTKLRKQFEDFETKKTTKTTTDFFYDDIAKRFLAELNAEIPFTYLNLTDLKPHLTAKGSTHDRALLPAFKLLHPAHLLREPFGNDSNSLNRDFYSELLHLIGLEEVKQGGKKLIQRKATPDPGSLLENTLTILDTEDVLHKVQDRNRFGATSKEQLSNIALALCLTWVNRVLFLKLLEAQLVAYHNGDQDYRFLSYERIPQYDELYKLFFQVLARKPEDRTAAVKAKFGRVPYLNSSLFEISALEDQTIRINSLDDTATLPLFPGTKLRGEKEKPGTLLPTLEYLFRFLDAYNFASEGPEEVQEQRKTLINASVLGLIFEKINGYRDGSFYTPGFITMYMARETIRRALVQKFNEARGWDCETFDDLVNATTRINKPEDLLAANRTINSLRLCDPAVGSGHFLVSALNELLACKQELGLLADRHGIRFKNYTLTVENDELLVLEITQEPELFRYRPQVLESQRLQETLFHEKQALIENCLFGVDLNPNSVRICRLRLWIELLKHAYYTTGSGFEALETLPNIDINIKEGNSLISRFALDSDLKQALKKSGLSMESYRAAVGRYQHAESKDEKREMERLIHSIKTGFRTEISGNDPLVKRRQRLSEEFALRYGQGLFTETLTKAQLKDREQKSADLDKLKAQLEEIKSNRLYENAFEWRFEFPEVLNEEGEFVGFDAVIGNPPYIRQEELTEIKPYLQSSFATYAGTADLFVYFIERGFQLLQEGGRFAYIVPNKWLRAGYGKALRNWLLQYRMEELIDFGDLPVFEEATTYPLILQAQKQAPAGEVAIAQITNLGFDSLRSHLKEIEHLIPHQQLAENDWSIGKADSNDLLNKLKQKSVPLGEYVNGKIYYGIKTGFNDAFVINETTKEKLITEDANSLDVIKPYLGGRDVKRYQQPQRGKYILFIPWHFPLHKDSSIQGASIEAEKEFEKKYPAVYNHLLQFKEPLTNRNKAETGIRYEWYALQRCAATYYDDFDKPKIICPAIVQRASYGYDTEGFYSNDKTTIIPVDDLYLLGVLSSRVVDFFMHKISSTKQNNYFEYKPVYLKQLPIATASEQQKETISSLVSQILDFKKAIPSANTSELEAQIDQLVHGLYELTEEEIALIESI